MNPRAYAQLSDSKHVSDDFDASAKYSHHGTHVRVDTAGTKLYVKPAGVTTDVQLAAPIEPATGGAVEATRARRGGLSDEAAVHVEPSSKYSAEEIKLRTAIAEVVGQEILRKFLPDTQPKYRLAIDDGNPPQIYVMSESVPGFKKPEADALKNKTFGKLIALCLYLGETDLKIGNLGQDDKGRPVKIDGDWLLTEFSKRCDPKHRGIEIKADSALFLPSLNPASGPKVFNWGDQYKATFAGLSKPKLFTNDLSFHPEIMAGVKEGFEELLAWKNDNIKQFLEELGLGKQYVDEMTDILIARRNNMELAYQHLLQHEKQQKQTVSTMSASADSYDSFGDQPITPPPKTTGSDIKALQDPGAAIAGEDMFKRLQALSATDSTNDKDATQENDERSTKTTAPAVLPDIGNAKKQTPQVEATDKKPKKRFGGSF